MNLLDETLVVLRLLGMAAILAVAITELLARRNRVPILALYGRGALAEGCVPRSHQGRVYPWVLESSRTAGSFRVVSVALRFRWSDPLNSLRAVVLHSVTA
jgi:hypothetical protein